MNVQSHAFYTTMLRADEVNLAYFAAREELPGVVLFCAERSDAPEFDLATIHDVAPDEITNTLHATHAWYRARQRRARFRLSPMSQPAGWQRYLVQAGYAESAERFTYFSIPPTLHLAPNTALLVRPVAGLREAALFSSIQVAGFDIPPNHHNWDFELTQRHLMSGAFTFYLAWQDGEAVGAARCCHLPNGATAMAALATLPAARRRGVGVTLLARMISDAREFGSEIIMGTVVTGSPAADLYTRLGFAMHFEATTYCLPPELDPICAA